DDPLVDPELAGRLKQRERVLRKAAAAIARPGVKELGPDAVVETDAPSDVLNVGVDRFAQVRDLIDEADLDREERIGGVLRQLRRPPPCKQDRRPVEEQRSIN